MHLLPHVKIALLASVTVSLWTVRVALMARGRRYVGAAVAIAEAMTFATVFAEVLASVDSPTRLTAYGLGVGAGTLGGLTIDQRFRTGAREASPPESAGDVVDAHRHERAACVGRPTPSSVR